MFALEFILMQSLRWNELMKKQSMQQQQLIYPLHFYFH